MRFYELEFDMERIDKAIECGTNTIFAETSNLDEIEFEGEKKGFFHLIIYHQRTIENWPDVRFYYDSRGSALESEYLLNVERWPIIHRRVMEAFQQQGIEGIEYYPIKLIDIVTQNVNTNYVVMYITNFIDGYDMEKSEYDYDEKYDHYIFLPIATYMNQSVCEKYDIFRCTKSTVRIYVSERIKKIVEENQWIGFEFDEMK